MVSTREDVYEKKSEPEAQQISTEIFFLTSEHLLSSSSHSKRKCAFLSSSVTDKKTQNFYKVFQKTINNSYCAIKAIFSRDKLY